VDSNGCRESSTAEKVQVERFFGEFHFKHALQFKRMIFKPQFKVKKAKNLVSLKK
jgi:hypothetical protein